MVPPGEHVTPGQQALSRVRKGLHRPRRWGVLGDPVSRERLLTVRWCLGTAPCSTSTSAPAPAPAPAPALAHAAAHAPAPAPAHTTAPAPAPAPAHTSAVGPAPAPQPLPLFWPQEAIGSAYKQDSAQEYAKVIISETNERTPALIVQRPGTDLFDDLVAFMHGPAPSGPKTKSKAEGPCQAVALTSAHKESEALELVQKGFANGGWIVLRNCYEGAKKCLQV